MAACCFRKTGVHAGSLFSIWSNCWSYLPENSICASKFAHYTQLHKLPVNYYCKRLKSDDTKGSDLLKFDIVVVGGGIVGIAAARELLIRHPNLKICVVEKEYHLAKHQTGNNSGVIHSGVYYKPGSLKAKLCVEGQELAYKYFDEHDIPYEKCGKLIVATNELEENRLEDLYKRGKANKVKDLKLINAKQIKKIEPYCKGVKALLCPHTGIVNWKGVTMSLACDFRRRGGCIFHKFEVNAFRETKDLPGGSAGEFPVTVCCNDNRSVCARFVLTCGGLYSDKLAVMSGCKPDPKIVPFRGEYLVLNPEKRHLVKGNIYPVPDPRFPFLGVHFTPRMDGSLWLGPNAVLAFGRESYSWGEINLRELLDILTFPGFYKLVFKHMSYSLNEAVNSLMISRQVKSLQKYIPDITAKDVRRGPAGVRAQAMAANGVLVDDFVFDSGDSPLSKHVLHCRNAPSPAATSCLAIACVVADRVKDNMDKN